MMQHRWWRRRILANQLAFVGVMPHVVSTEGVIENLPGMWSFAFGHAIYLDVDRIEEGAEQGVAGEAGGNDRGRNCGP